MPEPLPPERDRAALLQADAHARLSLLDLVVSQLAPQPPYATDVGRAREHLEAALIDIDAARSALDSASLGPRGAAS